MVPLLELRRLVSASGGTGLDPVTLGGAILSEVRDELPIAAMALYVPRGDTLAPLVARSVVAATADARRTRDVAAHEAWTTQRVVLDECRVAFPLANGAGGVVAATLSERVDLLDLGARVVRLQGQLRDSAVHLDTALLFAMLRDAAARDERRRLAREMHDGLAQDLATLGYLVDGLADGTNEPAQRERIAVLRARISGIVSDVRRSLVTLRNDVGAEEGLGTAIAAIARQLSESSGVPIRVTLEERGERLLPEVERELFRIAQEAMTNAVRHAEASTIEVACQVRAPAVRITVADDGRGMQPPRPDSQGLSIMRERAGLVSASLAVDETPGGGLTVTVAIDGDDLMAPDGDEREATR